MSGDVWSRTDEAMLELLLTYAIPQRDVQPLAGHLLRHFGSLPAVLAADPHVLMTFDGLKDHSVALLKLVDAIRVPGAPAAVAGNGTAALLQPSLFSPAPTEAPADEASTPGPAAERVAPTRDEASEALAPEVRGTRQRYVAPRRGSELVTNAVLKEAIELLPRLPDTDNLDEVTAFLRSALHYSAEQTRQRYAQYITRRTFPLGYADRALRAFARQYQGRQELRDVCFYRFVQAEPLMQRVLDDLLLPAIGRGGLARESLRAYLAQRFPESGAVKDAGWAVVEALTAGGIVRADRKELSFGYREPLLASFAFVVASEFPEPGMYDVRLVETNPAMRALLWQPERLMPMLYELRNHGLLAKVSDIDYGRQFTTRYDLEATVAHLVAEGAAA